MTKPIIELLMERHRRMFAPYGMAIADLDMTWEEYDRLYNSPDCKILDTRQDASHEKQADPFFSPAEIYVALTGEELK